MIINFALSELKLLKVIAKTQTANTASCRLLEKLGIRVEGTINRFRAEQAITLSSHLTIARGRFSWR